MAPMKVVRAAVLIKAATAVSSSASERQTALETAWSQELNSEKESPVKRVVNLITKMKAEIEEEGANEAAMYDKMVCWCETGEKEKTKAIADADAAMIDLQAEIESRSAKVGALAAEIANLKKQIAEDVAALAEAEKIREKEAVEARQAEKELVQAIANLKNAVAILEKVQFVQGSKSLLQLGAPVVSSLRVVLRDATIRHETMAARNDKDSFLAVAAGKHQDVLASIDDVFGQGDDALPLNFAEEVLAKHVAPAPAAFLQVATAPNANSYNSASNGIFGIMSQMLEEFQADLADKRKGEDKSQVDYEAMVAAKKEQVDAGKEKLDTMESDGAANLKALSDAKENLDLTQKQRSADVKYLQNLKLTCDDLDAQWEKRSKTRAAELEAVTETLEILTTDDNHEALNKGVPGFMQLSTATTMKALRSRAAKVLRDAAKSPDFDAEDLLSEWQRRSNSPAVGPSGTRAKLSTLAMSVQLDGFVKVKEAMDKLVAEMKKQTEEDVKLKAYCQKEFAQNEKDVFAKTNEKEDLEASMDQLASTMEKLAKEIADAQEQIAETNLDVKKASQNREKENSEFQTLIAEQRATQDILRKALTRLEDFYKKGKGKAALDQQTPPVQFNKQKDNAGASPVMGLLEQIIGDSDTLVKESSAAEYKAQADYETMVKDSTDLVAQLTASVVSKTKASAAAKKDASMAKSDHTSAVGELDALAAYNTDLHGQCDFLMKNFDIRQKARTQEIEAIQEAKGILSGAGR